MSQSKGRWSRTLIILLGVFLLCGLAPMAVSANVSDAVEAATNSIADPLLPLIEEGSGPELMACSSGIELTGFGPGGTIWHNFDSYWAGVIYATINGAQKATFCIDIHTGTGTGVCYEVGDSIANAKIVWILKNYPPSSSMSGSDAAAVQAAIWHFSDGWDMTWPHSIRGKCRDIIDAANQNSSAPPTPPTVNLSVDSQDGCTYTMRATTVPATQGIVLQLTKTAGSLSTSSVTTNPSGYATFQLTLSPGQCSTVEAKGNINVDSGVEFDSVPPGSQRLILGQPATVPFGGEKTVCCTCDVDVTVDNDSVCAGTAGTLTAQVTGSCPTPVQYSWTGPGGPAGSTQTIHPTAAGTYEVTVTCGNGCDATDSGTLTVWDYPTATAPSVTLCSGYTQAQLEQAVSDAGGGCVGGVKTVTDNHNGTYTVTCNNHGCTDSETGQITLEYAPTCSISGPTEDCIANSDLYGFSLSTPGSDASYFSTGTGATEWEWQVTGGSIVSGQHSSSIGVTWNGPGTKTVTLTVTNDCGSDTCSKTVHVYETPDAYAPPVSLCAGYSQADLEAAVAAAGGGCDLGSTTIQNNHNGTYSVTCDNHGCTDTATGNITEIPNPVATAPDVSLCAGYSQADLEAAVSAAGGGCTLVSGTVVDNGDGTYTVSCDNQGCEDEATGDITEIPNPVATAPDVSLCVGYSQADLEAAVSAAGGGCTLVSGTVVDNGDGTYTVSCDNQGCEDEATGDITEIPNPVATAPDVSLCVGYSQADLEAAVSAAGGGCTLVSGTVVDNGDGTYTVSCDNQGCEDEATGDITEIPNPVATAPDVSLCVGYSQADLEAAVSAAGGGCTLVSGTVVDNGDGTYTVSCDNQGCEDEATGDITEIPNPVATAPDVSLCVGYSQADLEAAVSAAGGGCTLVSGTVVDNGDGTYTVSCDNQGCEDEATGDITEIPNPVATAPDVSLCVGYSQADLEAAVSAAGGGCTLVSGTVVDNGDGTYTVSCDNQGCEDEATGDITEIPNPVATAPDVSLCVGYSQADLEAAVSAAGGGCTLVSGTVVDNGDGTYTVSCDNQGCEDEATGDITEIPNPVATAPDVSLCVGYSQADLEAAVSAAGGGCTLVSGTVVDNGDGTYTVSCDNQGCEDEATGDITEIPNPVATAPDVSLCAGYSQADLEAAVSAAGGGCTLVSGTVVDNGDGTYTVSCDNQGCEDEATGDITEIPNPVATAPDVSLCVGYSQADLEAAVSAAGGGCTLVSGTVVDNGDGTYTVSCDNQGCEDEATGDITEIPNPVATAPDVSLCVGYSQADLEAAVSAAGGGCTLVSGTVVDNGDGTYTVSCDNQGCEDEATGDITEIPNPVATAPDVSLCVGYSQADLEAAVSAAGGGCTLVSGTVVDNGDGTYTVSCDNQGCEDEATGDITEIPNPVATAPDVSLCVGYSQADLEAAVSAAGGGCTLVSGTVVDNGDGTYTVSCDNQGCEDEATGDITEIPNPVATAPDVSLCVGYSQADLEAAVSAAGGGCTLVSGTVVDNGDGTYTVSCDNQGCEDEATGDITEIPNPVATAPDVSLCVGYSQADLEAAVSAAGGGCTLVSGTVVDNGDGTYTVSCDNQGCEDEATGDITEIPNPVATAPDVSLCVGYSQADLEAAVSAAGGGCTLVSGTVVDNGDGTYTVSCDNQGCEDEATGDITVLTAPTCGVDGLEQACVGDTEIYSYDGNPGSGVTAYHWSVTGGGTKVSGGSTSDDWVEVSWASDGRVNLTVVNQCGQPQCGLDVDVEADPVCGFSGPAEGCLDAPSEYAYNGSGATNFYWEVTGGTIRGGAGAETASNITVDWSATGDQTVSLTVANRCNSDDCSKTVDIAQSPTCDFSGPNEAAIGETTTYTYTGVRATAWSWDVTGGTIQGDPTASSIDVLWDTPGAAQVGLLASNRCGESDCGMEVTLLASIGDYVWLDTGPLDGQQGGEPPYVAGVKVELYDEGGALLDTATTGANGLYGFDRLQPGKYSLRFYAPASYAITLKDQGADASDSDADRATGVTVQTELTPGEHDGTWDVGLFRRIGGGLGGYKFWDANISATWEQAVEPRIPGVHIVVRNASGAVVYETDTKNAPGTGDHGMWEFAASPGLLPGEYTITEGVPTNWVCTYPPANGNVYRIRSNADGTFELLSPMPAGFTGTLDFGNALPMGYKFLDENRSASRDSGESLLGGWRITLQDMSYNVVYSTRTVVGGSSPYYGWWFLTESLPEGDYYVFEDNKDGWEQTYPDGYNGAYKIHLYSDGHYTLLSGRNTWHDGLSFGNAPAAGESECPTCPEGVVFQSNRVEDNDNIFMMLLDGSEMVQLTDDLDQDVQPTWSFNGMMITFASNRDGDWEIYRMSADGTGQTNVTQSPLATDGVMPADDLHPSWSCEWITFQSNRDGNWEIYKTDPDGVTQIRLTENEAADKAPVWSYDGQWIAFQSDRDGNTELYIMDGEGENVQRLTDNEAVDANPTWSPDGEWIAFESDRDGQMDIYKINVATGEVIRLTENGSVDAAPAWAPYCDWIFWQTNRDNNWEVYRMEEDGTAKTNLSNDVGWIDGFDHVSSINRAPMAVDDEAETNQGSPVTIAVLDNDLDADGDALHVSAMSVPANGWCKLNADDTIVYTPSIDFVGVDTFTYTVSDVDGATDTATVTVTVNALAGMGRKLFLGIVVMPN